MNFGVIFVFVVGTALIAAVVDLRTGRIPNVLTFGAAALAFLCALIAGGPAAFGHAAVGWLLGLALFFPLFALGGMGAGDVKLVAALGAWLGPESAVWLVLTSAIAGGAMALVVALSRGYLRTAFSNIVRLLSFWGTVGIRPMTGLTLEHRRAPRLAYAVPIAVGAMVTLWLK